MRLPLVWSAGEGGVVRAGASGPEIYIYIYMFAHLRVFGLGEGPARRDEFV